VKNEAVLSHCSHVANGSKSSASSAQSAAVPTVIADLLSRIYIFEWTLSIILNIERERRPEQSFLVQQSVSECNMTGPAVAEENFRY
jgi:hypothetical protein